MAGIGFRLEKILSKNSYVNLLEGYAYAAMVSAGPLLCTIFSIALLSWVANDSVSSVDVMIFRTLVVYIYGLSLVTSSPAQMIITRYMADKIFLNDYKALVPAFVGMTILSMVLHAVIGFVASLYLDLDFGTEIMAIVLFVNIGIIWIAMIVLSAAKEFHRLFISFLIGASISVLAGRFLCDDYGLMGLISGFTMGQVVLVILLILQIFTEFDYRMRVEWYFIAYFKRFAALGFIATFYNIGVWGDKVVFWFTPETNENVHNFLNASYVYDTPMFLAYLFIVPSLAMFTVRIETSFYVHYQKYFLSILNKHPYFAIEERRKNIVKDLQLSLGRLLVLQGTITMIGLGLSPVIYDYLSMSAVNLGVFQIAILATFLQALLQTLLIITLYFDFRTDALIMSIVFAVTNIVFARLSIYMGFSWYGYGYFGSCLVSLLVGFSIFNYRIKHLLFYTFVTQKIIMHKETS
jgi:polysaccharide biosynthesis protein PelG